MTNAEVRHREEFSKATLGFWVYLMTDCVLFATLFATYAVLHGRTAGGASGAQLFDLNFVMVETLLLLTSSFTAGLALLALKTHNRKLTFVLLGITGLLGSIFVGMELYEFRELAIEGHGWTSSAFLSSYFTLVATHGLHITVGLIWLAVLLVLLLKRGLTNSLTKRVTLFSLFWHFLDIIWIFIFTLVYLFGALPS